MKKLIKDGRTLRAMSKKGFFRYPVDKPYKYVDEAGDNEFEYRIKGFDFNGKHYVIEYISGCFYPYVIEITN